MQILNPELTAFYLQLQLSKNKPPLKKAISTYNNVGQPTRKEDFPLP
ncbi:MAG: hypothetical protein AAFO96_01205 [Bacteroidota bacterium]